jgi:hypothetical protein
MRDDCCQPAINSRAKHFQRKRRIAQAFQDAGMPEMAQHLRDCQEISRQCICTHCAKTFYIPDRCRQRTCPLCSFKESRTRGNWIIRMCKGMAYPKMLTLTFERWRKVPGDGIDFIRDAWNLLRADPIFSKVKGGVYQIELKPKPDGWHIHMHVILDCPFLPYQQIFSAWRRLVGQDYANIDIRAAKTEVEQIYVAKYAAKAADYEGEMSDVVAWYLATKGKRLFGSFGSWYNKEPPSDSTDNPGEPFRFVCPCCGMVGTCCPSTSIFFVVGKQTAREFEREAASQGPPTLDLW